MTHSLDGLKNNTIYLDCWSEYTLACAHLSGERPGRTSSRSASVFIGCALDLFMTAGRSWEAQCLKLGFTSTGGLVVNFNAIISRCIIFKQMMWQSFKIVYVSYSQQLKQQQWNTSLQQCNNIKNTIYKIYTRKVTKINTKVVQRHNLQWYSGKCLRK